MNTLSSTKPRTNKDRLYFVGNSKEFYSLTLQSPFPIRSRPTLVTPTGNLRGNNGSTRKAVRFLQDDCLRRSLHRSSSTRTHTWWGDQRSPGQFCVKPTSPAPFSPAGHQAAATARCRVSGCAKPSSPAPFNTCYRSAETSATEFPAR